MTVEETHTKERIGIRGIDRDTPWTAIPENDSLMDIEHHGAAIAQHSATITSKRKTQGRNQIRRQSEIPIESRIDNSFDCLLSALKASHREPHNRFAKGSDPARDHASLTLPLS